VIPDLGDEEPLEDGLPDKTEPVTDFTGVPTMAPVPIPAGFVSDDQPRLEDLPIDPLL
jgi:hypothetical protein